MTRLTRIAISALAVGVLPALLAGVRDGSDAYAGSADSLPADGMTREQMAEHYAALAGAQFQPPACVAGQEMFDDVPASSLFCPFIEELARRGITTGCDADNFCPGDPVTRAQMATFVVKAQDEADGCRPAIPGTGEMVKVGSVCIDKYESSVWTEPDGGIHLDTEALIDSFCPDNGQDCKGKIFARSVPDVEPTVDITWFQAQQALANSGKRLPTNAEWQMAVAGTPDPGTDDDATDCNISFDSGQDPVDTGSRSNCVSDWGAFDMVGNVWEWVADWDEVAAGCDDWSATFGDDRTCVGRGDGDFTTRFPGALFRGGGFSFADGADAGPFAVSGGFRPSSSGSGIGFRGAR